MPPEFSLQPVLDYRHSRVEVLEVELGQLLQSKRRGETFLQALEDSRERIYKKLEGSQHGDIDLFLVSRLRSSLKTVNERIIQQQERLHQLSLEVQSKRDEMIAAKQDEEVLVTLKDRAIERYETEQAQEEKKLQDDIYISQAYRRSTSTA